MSGQYWRVVILGYRPYLLFGKYTVIKNQELEGRHQEDSENYECRKNERYMQMWKTEKGKKLLAQKDETQFQNQSP